MLTVVTTATPDYGRPWVFSTLGMLSCRVACLLDPSDKRPLPVNAKRHPYVTPGVQYQDGRFLDAVPGVADEDVVVLADADGVFQRDFDQDELDTFADLRGGFAMGYNLGPGQRGEEEYRLLRPKQPLEEAAQVLGLPLCLLRGAWVYNTGFMAARASTWRHLHCLYAETFGGVDGGRFFALHSWPQYFICLTLCLNGLPTTELGYETHSHGHFPLTARHTITRRQLHYAGRLVLYAHNVCGASH